jgi:hypothetical protein
MLRFYAYLIIAAFGILITLLGNSSAEVVFAMTAVYFVSTLALTFRIVNLADEADTNLLEKPVYYYERQTGFNLENYIRVVILVISAVAFVPSGNAWWLILVCVWFLASLTVIVPWLIAKRDSDWDIVCEAIALELDLPRQTILQINRRLKKKSPKTLSISDINVDRLTPAQKQDYLDLYLKILREITL